MRYRIELRKSAEKALKKVDRRYQRYLYEGLLELGEEPRGHKCEQLRGVENGYRKVAWPYRILYTINDESRYEAIHGGDSVNTSPGTGAPAPEDRGTHGRKSVELQNKGVDVYLIAHRREAYR